MGSYLNALKKTKNGEGTTLQNLKNPVDASFVGFVGTPSPPIEKNMAAKVGAGDTATASRWWLIHYPERDPVKVVCFPEATHAEILERHPDATTAEPFIPIIQQATTPLSAEVESAIRAWLALIEETDLAIVAEVMRQCQQDADARHYFNGRAAVDPLKMVFSLHVAPLKMKGT